MGFFDRYFYGKAGKRDYSEMDMPQNRVSLFFLVLKDHIFDLVKVNLLQVLFWLPFLIWTFLNLSAVQSIDAQAILAQENGSRELISSILGYVTMWLLGAIPCLAMTGPSSAGAAYIMRNWARDQHAFLFSDYKDAFKENWKQALGISCLTAFVPVLTYTAVSFYGQIAASNALMFMPLVLVISMALVWTLMLPLLYPMIVGYELRFSNVLKNAFLMSSARLPQLLMARLITFIPIGVLLVGLYLGNAVVLLVISLYYIVFGFAFSRLVYASVANSVFDRYLNPRIEGAPVGMGLRPQDAEDELDDDEDDEEEDEDE